MAEFRNEGRKLFLILRLPQFSHNWHFWTKKKELNFCLTLSFSAFLLALQDGLGFKKMKSTEIFRNCKKLKRRQLRMLYEKFSKAKISPNLKNWVQIGCNFQKKCVSLHPVKRI
jgi:hypothetical protein